MGTNLIAAPAAETKVARLMARASFFSTLPLHIGASQSDKSTVATKKCQWRPKGVPLSRDNPGQDG